MPDFPNTAHHIVAGNAPSAEAARQILLEYGVDIDDSANGVFLPTINNPDARVGVLNPPHEYNWAGNTKAETSLQEYKKL